MRAGVDHDATTVEIEVLELELDEDGEEIDGGHTQESLGDDCAGAPILTGVPSESATKILTSLDLGLHTPQELSLPPLPLSVVFPDHPEAEEASENVAGRLQTIFREIYTEVLSAVQQAGESLTEMLQRLQLPAVLTRANTTPTRQMEGYKPDSAKKRSLSQKEIAGTPALAAVIDGFVFSYLKAQKIHDQNGRPVLATGGAILHPGESLAKLAQDTGNYTVVEGPHIAGTQYSTIRQIFSKSHVGPLTLTAHNTASGTVQLAKKKQQIQVIQLLGALWEELYLSGHGIDSNRINEFLRQRMGGSTPLKSILHVGDTAYSVHTLPFKSQSTSGINQEFVGIGLSQNGQIILTRITDDLETGAYEFIPLQNDPLSLSELIEHLITSGIELNTGFDPKMLAMWKKHQDSIRAKVTQS